MQIILTTIISLNNQIYSWDEASYILNAKDISGKLNNSLQERYVVHERHPLLTWTLGAMYYLNLPEFFTKLLIPMFYVGLIILAYFFGKRLFDENVGIYSALFISTSSTMLASATKIWTDVPGAFLVSLTLFSLYRGIKDKKWLLLAGLAGGLSVLMRDSNLLLLPIFGIYFLTLRKSINKKYFYLSIVIFTLSVMPYFIDNYRLWGDPLYRIKTHTTMVVTGVGFSESITTTKIAWLGLLPYAFSLPLFMLLVLYLFKYRPLQQEQWFLFSWLVVSALATIFLLGLEKRYALALMIPGYLYAANALDNLSKYWKVVFVAAIFILNGFLIDDFALYNSLQLTKEHKEAFDFVKNNTEENITVFTNNNPPAMIVLQSNRLTYYNTEPELNKEIKFYLLAKEMYPKAINESYYIKLFENHKFAFYKRK